MEAGDCPTLNMNAMENYLLSHSLRKKNTVCRIHLCLKIIFVGRKFISFNECLTSVCLWFAVKSWYAKSRTLYMFSLN